MTPEQLKASILQRAMEGKLVPQNPNDEPASELLKRIKAEKEKLISEGKIKRDKKETEIFRGDDGKHYGKFADGSTQEIDVPYDIPDTWEWVRLNDITSYIQRGKSPKYSNIPIYPVIAQKCNQWSGFSIDLARFIDPETVHSYQKERLLRDGDLMWNSTGLGTLGRLAIYHENKNPYGWAVADSHVTVIRVLSGFINCHFIYNFLSSPIVQSVIEEKASGSTKQKELLTKTIKEYLIPLPPLAEQQRIIEAIESALEKVDEYAESYNRLEQLDKEFPDKLKKSILQYAMQGKLVEQDPNDESVEVLLEKIRAEKQKLFEEGKIKKKDLDISIVSQGDDSSYYEEVPYEIPKSWEWVRFSTLVEIVRGGSPRPIKDYLTSEVDGINWIKIGDTEKGEKYINNVKEKIKKSGLNKTRFVKKGTFLLTNSMSFGRPYILNVDGAIHDGWLAISNYENSLNRDYLFYILSSNVVYSQFLSLISGAVVKNLNSDKVASILIPLPPLPEQSRIVDKIEQFFAHIDALI
ncbi:restriction endonuclease subunit S [Streptococcus pseudopneumoniae]|uniref:restriction endonuclease subunit S n=1 Tax=Streptococcus pseudopneumoniae TaxID=257758 RepID=UPI0018B0A3B9|nr:restriction endonuclease subunit S [Streptococcus pseudopneumoniae]MBF9656121.1 restriction endonuclease subunit S [Streptococcus pseudopneumoniae]MCE2617742.1 restriction endonuclease subunit S [Streptococcus pseudopneumoniae]